MVCSLAFPCVSSSTCYFLVVEVESRKLMFSHNFKRNDKKETMVEEAIPNYLRTILKLLMCNKFVLPVSKDFNS